MSEQTATSTMPDLSALRKDLPPKPAQGLFELPAGKVGVTYRATTPAFLDPTRDGLSLSLDGALPPGLIFADRGDGSAEVSGAPQRAGSATLHIVATTRAGKSAGFVATLTILDAAGPTTTPTPTQKPKLPPPPTAPQPAIVLDAGSVGQDYAADLPPFRAGAGGSGLALHPDPNPPDGLNFADLGGGFSQISGKPTRPGDFAFDVVAVDGAGQIARMGVRIAVASTPVSTPSPTSASPSPTAVASHPDAAAFLANYSGDPCFLARPAGPANDPHALVGVGADRSAFQRFDAAFRRDVGFEPKVTARLIAQAQCPALDLVRLSSGREAPRIELANEMVGSGRPLAGTVRGLAGRRLALFLVDNDGDALALPAAVAAGGDVASFSAPLKGVDDSLGPLQLLVAIVSNSPIASLDGFKSMAVADLARKVGPELPRDASASLEFFKLTK